MNDFYTRLKNGETAEDIVSKITAELNEAEARLKEEKAQAERNKEDARTDLAKLFLSFGDWANKYYPDLVEGELTEDMCDKLAGSILSLLDLGIMELDLFSKTEPDPNPDEQKKTEAKAIKRNSDPFADFFKSFGL